MIDLTKYDLTDEDLKFIGMIKDDIKNQNEIYLQYNGKSFVVEPSMNKLEVYAYGETLGLFNDFDDLFLNYKINGIPLINLVKELDFA